MKVISVLEAYCNENNKYHTLKQLKHLFDTQLKGRSPNSISKHCGAEGHFIEKCLDIEHNSKNEPDYEGWEIKKKSKNITFGDWSSTSYLFNQNKFMKKFNNIPFNIPRNDFIKFFGSYNIKKERWAWSGKCIPKINTWNYNGTIMVVDKNGNIFIVYSHCKDTRNAYLPKMFTKQEFIILQYWDFLLIKRRVEDKFNKHGFVIFDKNEKNEYDKMLIGKTIDVNMFLEMLKTSKIIFDSGMYEGNLRNYSLFRSNCKVFEELIIEEYC